MDSASSTSNGRVSERVSLEDLFPLDNPPSPLRVSTLRWYARHRETNGFVRCMVRIGRRDFVVLSRFEAWLAEQLTRAPDLKGRGGR